MLVVVEEVQEVVEALEVAAPLLLKLYSVAALAVGAEAAPADAVVLI